MKLMQECTLHVYLTLNIIIYYVTADSCHIFDLNCHVPHFLSHYLNIRIFIQWYECVTLL